MATVEQIITVLKDLPPTAEVKIWIDIGEFDSVMISKTLDLDNIKLINDTIHMESL